MFHPFNSNDYDDVAYYHYGKIWRKINFLKKLVHVGGTMSGKELLLTYLIYRYNRDII